MSGAAGCALRPIASEEERAAYHRIRRESLFEVYHPGLVYDSNGPDEARPGNHPRVLVRGGEVVGTVRIDLVDEGCAALRIVTVRRDLQGQGLGRLLLALAEEEVRALGRREVVLNAGPQSLAFYLSCGYSVGAWRDASPPWAGATRVGKRLG